ncbi:protein disulfide oxidoreductase trx domain protein [Alkalihalophilus pseudofirmus OF4]|uniref:Protein disulfide oxidoreductase trx domain protein n=1 Tax=Alkalihalophilus pseudofirmus (strain ATCC BAA-2126 / JCM 17055 / OF4) TaxID=398511 RepID=D3FZE0_ALKPO|nr:thioredoxin family protein [Alkalihalophilus pseudofirmus]ADC51009.1 protein disulfide oxidoreductase trx domain protein [Alkalihalophilus pseudofirmus OF4]
MKKVLIFGGIIVILFGLLAVVNSMKQSQLAEGNPFGKERIDPATAELVNDPNYQNVILPEELEEILEDNGDVTVYFYSSTCPYCKEATPRLVPISEELGVDLVQYNLTEFDEGWSDHNIESTPTIVQFENGEEVDRIVGSAPDEEYRAFFERNVNN